MLLGSQIDSGEVCVSSHHHVRWRLMQIRQQRACVKVPVTQIFLGENSLQVVQNPNFQSESLILAQNERWRQA